MIGLNYRDLGVVGVVFIINVYSELIVDIIYINKDLF